MRNRNIELITSSLKCQQVMEHYGVEFNSRGFARCPFHSEKTASLTIKQEHYKCFGCGAYGGSIDFVMRYFNLTLPQAILKIGHDFGLTLDGRRPTYKERVQKAENRRMREAEQEIEKEIKDNYNWLCDVHRALFKAYVRSGSERLERITDKLSDILDDFSGEEARAWEWILFGQNQTK